LIIVGFADLHSREVRKWERNFCFVGFQLCQLHGDLSMMK